MGSVLHLVSKKFKITLYLEHSYASNRKITFTVTNRWHSKTEQSRFRSMHRAQPAMAKPEWR